MRRLLLALLILWPVNSSLALLPSRTEDGLISIPLYLSRPTRRRRRRLQNDTAEGLPQQVDALYQGYGEHLVDLWCGTPPQRQTMIINTGGHGTAFPCSGCKNDCGLNFHTDNYFQEENSMTFHQLTCSECQLGACSNADPTAKGTCRFGVAYVEGSSWWATESRDTCYIGGLHNKPISIDDKGHDDLDPEHAVAFKFDLLFGCQTEITGLFRTQLADGILAMDNSPFSFWRQMYKAGKLKDEMFSLCYVRQDHADRNGTQAGAMTLGGSDDRLHLHPMVFTKHYHVSGFFGVQLRKVYLREGGGGDSVNATKPNLKIIPIDIAADKLNQGGIIVESGTTDSYLTKELLAPFKTAWSKFIDSEYSNGKPLFWTYDQIQSLPTIIFQFEGSEDLNKDVGNSSAVINLARSLDPDNPYDVLIAMPPNHYMQYNPEVGSYSACFFMDEYPSGFSTLGANTIMGHDVLFDSANDKIGWAESLCNYDHLIEKAGFNTSGADQPPVGPLKPKSPAPAMQPPTFPSSDNKSIPPKPSPVPGGSNASSDTDNSSIGKPKASDDSTGLSGGGAKAIIVGVVAAGLLILFIQRGAIGAISNKVWRRGRYRNVVVGESELELQTGYAENGQFS